MPLSRDAMTAVATPADASPAGSPLAGARAGVVPRFHRLIVGETRRETRDAITIRFEVPSHLAADYHFEPGQYLTLRAVLDGDEVRRSYSICSGPDDGELRIAVKRLDNGLFSDWANAEVKIGDAV